MSTSFKSLHFERRGDVVELTFARSDGKNALDRELLRDLATAVMRVQTDTSVRAVLLTGSGDMFCAGADIRLFLQGAGDEIPGVMVREGAMHLHAAVSGLVRLHCPVVTAANGSAGGAGFSLLLAGDAILCAEGVKLRTAYSRMALTPDGGMTALMGRVLGPRRTLLHYYLNTTFTPEEARDLGLVDRVLPKAELLPAARALAEELARGPREAFKRAKQVAYRQLDLETQLEAEREAIANAAASVDVMEAAMAFMEKRPPRFNQDG
jgi:2-(1,2-epoxy-1,2-dihydrophenyl)acetyl-CoA isomerase